MRPRESDDGLTLVEILLATLLLGGAVVVILTGMAASIRFSNLSKKQATAETLIRNVAEDLKTVQTYGDCAAGYTPSAAVSADITAAGFELNPAPAVTYWDGDSFESTCPTDKGLQRITIWIRSTDGVLKNKQLQVVKRK